jgi:UDP-2,3-diacylglucosamine hydrolase
MNPAPSPSSGPFPTLQAPADWQCVEFISDLHLHPSEWDTFQAWQRYLTSTSADAVFILGDMFEVWVGDDAASIPASFEAECIALIAATASKRPVFFMHGNRDFLLGDAFATQSQAQYLSDPTVLCFGGKRFLLSHGDALCLSDTEYQKFRTEVRSAVWQQSFLAQPLAERIRIAREIRTHSEARKLAMAHQLAVHDLDTTAVNIWLAIAQASTLIHGHTHQPASHDLGEDRVRVVLSDWDASAQPPRAQVLRLMLDSEVKTPQLTRCSLN